MDLGFNNSVEAKKQKLSGDISRCNNDDRISNLPDAVISHILSFLTTKDAVGTTILSKRWNYLWTSVKNLDFDSSFNILRNYHLLSDDITKSFVNFIDRVLLFHDGMSIDKFRLSSSNSRVRANHIYAWISAVIPCHVKEIQITLTSYHQTDLTSTKYCQVDLPYSLFTCKTLTILKLSGSFVLNLPYRVCLPVLKILHLNSVVYVDDVSLQKLISGCPVLEDLDIERRLWDGVRVISISSQILKRFSMQFFLYGHSTHSESCSYKVHVSASNLVYLKLADNMGVEYSVDNIPSLVEAHIGVYNYSSSRSLELVEDVNHVRILQLSGKILEFMETGDDYKLPVFHNLYRLELGANKEAGWDLLPEILESMPNLEVLVFPRGLVKRINSQRKPYYEFDWYLPESVPACLLHSLETIIIHEFFGKNCEIDLVEYLLENAKVLKKMTINFLYFKRSEQESCQRTLLRCKRGSPACQLEFILKDSF